MFKSLTISAILGATLMLAQPGWAAQRFVVRRPGPVVVVRPSYGYWPHWYGYNPWWGPAYVAPAPATGEVKLVTRMKDASVYINGGYAGIAGKLKHFDLSPGNYDIDLKNAAGQSLYHDRIQVLLDKTTEIRVD